MSLTLDLSPDIMQQLQKYADREGVSVPVMAQRLLESALRQKQNSEAMRAGVARAIASLGETDEETEAFINGTVKRFRETYAQGKNCHESPNETADVAR